MKVFTAATILTLAGVLWVNLSANAGSLWLIGGVAVLAGSAVMLGAFIGLCVYRSSWRVLLPAVLIEASVGFPLLVTSLSVAFVYGLVSYGITS